MVRLLDESPLPKPPPFIGRNGLADWSLENATRRHIARVMTYCRGNLAWAASEMGIHETTLWRWLRRMRQGRAIVKRRRPRG